MQLMAAHIEFLTMVSSIVAATLALGGGFMRLHRYWSYERPLNTLSLLYAASRLREGINPCFEGHPSNPTAGNKLASSSRGTVEPGGRNGKEDA